MSAPSAIRRAAQGAFELAGTTSGLAAFSRRLQRTRVSILAYHNVVDPAEAGHGESTLHLPLPEFRRQVEWIAETHSVVSLGSTPEGGDGRPRAVITFDDAYRGAVTLALPELAARALPATVFASPGLLGSPSTWWDEMAEGGLLTPSTRRFAMHELAGRAEAVREWAFGARQIPELPASYGIATSDELRANLGGGISLGSHTWGHEHLPSLGDEELRTNLLRTRTWLEGFDAPTPPWLALPYGADSAAARRLALATGHAGVLRVAGGLWKEGRDRGHVPRIYVPADVTLRGLQLRVSGLMPS